MDTSALVSALKRRFEEYIVSPSGIRAIMAPNGEEDPGASLAPVDSAIAFLVGYAGAEFLLEGGQPSATLAVGRDSRPTGDAVAQGIVAGILARKGSVRYLGVCPSPQIMAYSRSLPNVAGFIYASASHNPVGHNGYKIGGSKGGVLDAEAFLRFSALLKKRIATGHSLLSSHRGSPSDLLRATADSKAEYTSFLLRTIFDTPDTATASERAAGVAAERARQPIELVIDFNGSARTVGPDVELLKGLGVGVTTLNDSPGRIAHQILPEGPGIEECLSAVERLGRAGDPTTLYLGYVPDNDGDRGNIVVYNSELRRGMVVHPQSLLALAAVAELSYEKAMGPGTGTAAVVANGPTSLRLDRVVEALGARVFRSEVGEANVVSLAASLRQKGYEVRVMGEGSNGGVIIHPSAVRDPLLTLGALIKLLRLPGLAVPGDTRRADALSRLFSRIPAFVTSQTGDPDAILRLHSVDHPRLKARYEELAEARWQEVAESILEPLGIDRFRWINYEGTEARRGRGNRSPEATGGLKFQLEDAAGAPRGFLWFRGSKTEPVMRLMVDLEGDDREAHRKLMEWHRGLLVEAAGME